LKVVHISVSRQFSYGQLSQLKYEYNAAQTLEGHQWVTVGYHVGPSVDGFIKKIPFIFRGMFLRNLYGWLVAVRLSRSHDLVLMRHMTFDPFALIFARVIKNRVSIHHSKEVEELKVIRPGWKGRLASVLERFCAKVSVCNAQMILGVTEEISEYERLTYCIGKNTGVYSNGIELSSIDILADRRDPVEINVAFICGTFSNWHGLDRLFRAFEEGFVSASDPKIRVHLIGRLLEDQVDAIKKSERLSEMFVCHGLLDRADYYPILEKCDYGITSLALERKSLREASTLKVREMLALGLPVFSGHIDVALPRSREWVKVVNSVCLSDLISFGVRVKKVSRNCVREESAELIDKKEIMKKTLGLLDGAV